ELVWSTNTTPFEPQRIVIQNLIEGVLYYFRIWLRDDSNNWSQPSNQTSSYPKPTQDTTPPAKIENVSLTAGPNGSQITVIWQATGDDGTIKNIVDGMYRIRYSTYTQLDWSSNIGWTQPGIRYQIEVSTNVTSGTYQTVILSGLIEGVTYYMRIWLRDENTDNWSEMSDIFSTYAKTEPPSPITDLKAEGFFFGIKEGEVRLSWTAVGDNGNIGIAAQYIIKVSTLSNINDDMGFSKAQLLSDFSNVVIPEPQQSGTKQTLLITGLIPGVSYYFAIKVKDNAGLLSQWYRDTVVNTENYAMAFDESPPSVTNLSITELDKQLILQWNYNFATVKDFSHFIVYCDSTPPILWDNSFVIGQTTSTYLNITNLENGVLYNFKVIAVDMLPFVLESQPEIIYGTPNISIPLAATDFTGIAVSTTTILWKWKYNSSNVNYYSIYNSTGGLLIENPIEPPIPEYGEWEETDLSPNTSSYVSYIILTNLVGNSQPCYVSSTVFTFANPPSNVSLVMISSIVYRLTFSQNGNSTITRYAIYLSTDNVEYRKVKDLEDNFTISNLPLDLVFEPDNTYFLKLKAYNQQGIPSDEIIFSTGTYDEIPPAKVTDLTIQLSENPAEVVAKWTSSGDNGDKKILFGKIEIRWSNNPLHTWDLMPQNNRIVISTVSTPGEIQSFNISGLAYNTTFYFYIKLIDDYGNISEVSNKATIYIPEPSKIPNFVAGIKITQKNQNSITINWSKVTKNKDGSICNDIIAYKIYKSTISFENVQLIGQANSNVFYYTDTNYTQSSLSYYTVRAVNSLNVEGQSIMYVNSEGTVIFLGDIPEVRVEIPYASSSVLYKLENIFDEDLIVKVASKSISGYILNYDINFYGYDTLSRYEVSLPPVGVSILCAIKNHLLDELQVYYWLNDKETLLITDIEKIKTYNVIKINAAKLGLFSFKKEKLLDTEITIEKTKPRIITPLSNDENYNKATIYINNFQKQPVIKTRVYDLRGSLIIDNLKEEKKDFIYSWDGRDKNGEIVADGPYIYEIHISNKILRGIIIVAR
ncbi:MAG: hypothetical protein N2643_02805, partial [Endomicrobia bacterium]|nr:hypothetical protein [Endomicrobiia bacterium]